MGYKTWIQIFILFTLLGSKIQGIRDHASIIQTGSCGWSTTDSDSGRRGVWFLWRSGQILYSVHSDIIAEHLATKTVLYDAIHKGEGIPFWRGDQFSGYPAFTNPQSLYTYPLHLLFYLQKPADAIGGTLWLHFVAAAIVF